MTKEEYISYVKSQRDREIYIYGAGEAGRRLLQLLLDNHLHVSAFLVTDERVNKMEEAGIPIIGIERFSPKSLYLILVAVKSPWNRDIVNLLETKGIKDYMDIIPELSDLNSKPELFEITTCIGCKVACKYCPQELLNRKYIGERKMSLDTFICAIDKIPKSITIAFSGFSEPFLNKNTADMICYAADKGHKIWLNTTLVGMKKEDFEKIKDIPIDNFVLHIPDKYGYAHIPITDDYLELLERVIDWKCFHLGKWDQVVKKANCQGEPDRVIVDIIDKRLLIFSELADRAGNLSCDEKTHSVKGRVNGKIYCNYSPTLNNMVMLPNGDTYLCCMDFGLKHLLGNIVKQKYEDLRESEELKRIKHLMEKDDGDDILCRHCTEARSIIEK